jgi:putative transposase
LSDATHYHILVRVKAPSDTSEVFKTSEVSEVSRRVSLAMQKFGISYTKAINKRFNRVGALFQGQFEGKPVEHYNHLLNLYIYIHANPVRDQLVMLPEEWEFSNYLEWRCLRNGTLVNREFIYEYFVSPEEYLTLVMDYFRTRKLPEDVNRYLLDLEG